MSYDFKFEKYMIQVIYIIYMYIYLKKLFGRIYMKCSDELILEMKL